MNKNTEKQVYVSLFENGITQINNGKIVDIITIFEQIQSSTELNKKISLLRNENNTFKKDNLKKSLPYITPSGTFHSRRDSDIIDYSGLICIDLDKLNNLEKIKHEIILLDYTFACFTSPSGNGLKVFFRVPLDINLHKDNFLSIKKILETKHIIIDSKCKDISRACFLSFDKDIYLNPSSQIFIAPNIQYLDTEKYEIIKENFIKANKHSFTNGNRNNFVFELSCTLNRYGLDEATTKNLLINDFSTHDFLKKEIEACVKSAYKHTHEHNTYFLKDKTVPSSSNKRTIPLNVTKKIATKKTNKTPEITLIKKYLNAIYDFRYNEISNDIEFKEKSEIKFKILNENNLYIELLEKGYKASEKLLFAILKSDFVPSFNPIKDYFESLPEWTPIYGDDGSIKNNYIEELASYINAEDQPRFLTQFTKMLVRMVACSLGIEFNKHAFILIGKQNDGKTTFLRNLCPNTLKNYFTETFNPDDKDAIISLSQNFMINLDELATLSRKDVNKIKSLISADKVKVRKPYERKDEITKRIANFVGSTNDDDFLVDSTGSVRWLCFEINTISFDYMHKIDMNKVYSQAHTLLKRGFEYKLTQQEILENESANSQFSKRNIEMDLLEQYFIEDQEKETENFRRATDILLLLKREVPNLNLNEINLGKALKAMNIKKSSKSIKGIKRWGYFLKLTS